ncbi:unnamed protein product, partial [Prorocentrum cordatum]
ALADPAPRELEPPAPTQAPSLASGSTATATSTTVTPEAWWSLTSGACIVDGRCVHSPGYPAQYQEGSACEFELGRPAGGAYALRSSYFHVGAYPSDVLTVNGVAYAGAEGPDGVVPSGPIQWGMARTDTPSPTHEAPAWAEAARGHGA